MSVDKVLCESLFDDVVHILRAYASVVCSILVHATPILKTKYFTFYKNDFIETPRFGGRYCGFLFFEDCHHLFLINLGESKPKFLMTIFLFLSLHDNFLGQRTLSL